MHSCNAVAYFYHYMPVTNELTLKLCRAIQSRGIKEFEFALLANLMPETAEEAMTLIPSLKVGSKYFHRVHSAPCVL